MPSDLADNHKHRHASHLYEVFYGLPETLGRDGPLSAAFAKAIQRRMEFRIAEPTGEMAFGLVQLGQAALSLRQTDAAEHILDWLTSWYWTRGLTTTHNKGQIFNTDICGGVPEIISRMLIDSQPGRIEVLPNKPARWRAGSVSGLRARGAVRVHSLIWSPDSIDLTLIADEDQLLSVLYHEDVVVHTPADQVVPRPTRRVDIALTSNRPFSIQARRNSESVAAADARVCGRKSQIIRDGA